MNDKPEGEPRPPAHAVNAEGQDEGKTRNRGNGAANDGAAPERDERAADEREIETLACMSELEYDRAKKDAAKRLRASLTTLNKLVKDAKDAKRKDAAARAEADTRSRDAGQGTEPPDRAPPAGAPIATTPIGARMLRGPAPSRLPSPLRPKEVARAYIEAERGLNGDLTLCYWRGSFWAWATTHWAEMADDEVRATLYQFTEHAHYGGDGGREPWAPTSKKIADLLDALRAAVLLDKDIAAPCWLDGRKTGPIIAVANGLLDVDKDVLLGHTPLFFGLVAVPFSFDRNAPEPQEFLKFLDTIWPDDRAAIQCLQEWYGYSISGRVDLQKILALQGPTRSGKGVLTRTLSALIGAGNVCSPTIAGLSETFALQAMLGKSLAIVGDARADEAQRSTISGVAIERLLSISAGDPIDVRCMYKPPLTSVRLLVRFIVVSNMLPKFGDASGAIVGRLVVLSTTISFLGREDREIETRVAPEMPGVLNWALRGLKRLIGDNHGRFTRQPAAENALRSVLDMAAPISAFVRERCKLDAQAEYAKNTLYAEFKDWAEQNGHRVVDEAQFARDLMAAFPSIGTARPRRTNKSGKSVRLNIYTGVRLATDKDDPEETTLPGL